MVTIFWNYQCNKHIKEQAPKTTAKPIKKVGINAYVNNVTFPIKYSHNKTINAVYNIIGIIPIYINK